ncbi:protein YAE1 homolog [Hyperolius riggenbachi]|uniref:protein YAE1 homolog n=1 Tax=Hyperolius riggenbachi TaxID=752182 RepID=UPI0035A29151
MAWARAAVELQQQREGDVFDEQGDEMTFLHRDWKRSMEKRLKEGYLDGVDAGKENSLQAGFNMGYKEGVNMLIPLGEIRGIISALITWCQAYSLNPSLNAQLGDLLTATCQCEDQIVKDLSSIHQDIHPSELTNSVENMVLSSHVQEANQGSCGAGQDCCSKQDCLPSPVNCRTTQQLKNVLKQELSNILKHTCSVANQLNVSADLLNYLQSLYVRYSAH